MVNWAPRLTLRIKPAIGPIRRSLLPREQDQQEIPDTRVLTQWPADVPKITRGAKRDGQVMAIGRCLRSVFACPAGILHGIYVGDIASRESKK